MKHDVDVYEVPEMSPDPRVRVFRRTLSGLEDLEGMEVDAYLVLGERYAFIFDTLVCPADIAAVMAICAPDIKGKQVLCVNSHADWDHIWGNGYFSGPRSVPILAHSHCRERINAEEARQQLGKYQARYPLFRDVTLMAPSITFNERLVINDNNLTIELLHAPGHCQDQIVAWLPEISLLLAFDAIEKPLPSIEDSTCAPLIFSTLKRLAALNAQYVLCSHGSTTSPALIHENQAYLDRLASRVELYLPAFKLAGADFEHVAESIGYPFDEVIANATETVDHAYYSWVHEHNARAVLRWRMQE